MGEEELPGLGEAEVMGVGVGEVVEESGITEIVLEPALVTYISALPES